MIAVVEVEAVVHMGLECAMGRLEDSAIEYVQKAIATRTPPLTKPSRSLFGGESASPNAVD